MAELKQLGVAQAEIARACRRGQATISLIARGVTKDPSYSVGVAILRLVDNKRAERAAAARVPTEQVPLGLVDRRERSLPVDEERRQNNDRPQA